MTFPFPTENFHKKTQEELLAYAEMVVQWILEDEEMGNPFSKQISRSIGELDITAHMEGKIIYWIHFSYQKKRFNPFFFYSIERNFKGNYSISYRASESDPTNYSFKVWKTQPTIIKFMEKIDFKKKIDAL